MKQYSAKRSKQMREYKKIRVEFLEANPLCERCGGIATTVHHKKGRMGELIINTEYFLPACMPCHEWIETHPGEAKEKGYSISRL